MREKEEYPGLLLGGGCGRFPPTTMNVVPGYTFMGK